RKIGRCIAAGADTGRRRASAALFCVRECDPIGYRKCLWCYLRFVTHRGGQMGSRRECPRILGLDGFRVEAISWEGNGPSARVRISIERRGIRGYECSGCQRRTWRGGGRAGGGPGRPPRGPAPPPPLLSTRRGFLTA